jgi:IclR family KDG regulon transcriptional repressor
LSVDRYLINSVLRAAKILESFSMNKFHYTNSELAIKLGLNKSTVTRLLYSLEKAGFLVRDPKTREYCLTHSVFRIGNVYINQIDLHKEAMPLLNQLSLFCKETVHLAILHGFEVFYLHKVEGPQSIRMASSIGNTSPAYCTGVGKAMLAYLKKDDLDRSLEKIPLKRYTQKTICDPDDLRLELERIRERGYAIDDSEHEQDVKCVAAPIRDCHGDMIAAISIAAPSFRMVREKIEREFIPAVTQTANEISKRLGYMKGG